MTHGRQFVAQSADAFTAIMIKFCLEDYNTLRVNNDNNNSSNSSGNGSKDLKFNLPSSRSETTSSGSSSTLASTSIAALAVSSSRNNNKYAVPITVADILHLFSNTPRHLKMLLEGVFDGLRQRTRVIHSRITMTLLELYFQDYNDIRQSIQSATTRSVSAGAGSVASGTGTANSVLPVPDISTLKASLTALEERIMSILDGIHVQYDHSHVLLLCHAYEFPIGEQFLLEQTQSVELLARMHIEASNDRGLYRILRREGRKDPELYVQVLTYFVNKTIIHSPLDVGGGSAGAGGDISRQSSDDSRQQDVDDDEDEDDDDERWSNVIEILTLIESENILSVSQVVSILARNPDLPYSIISKYINKTIVETTDELQTLEKDIGSMRRVVDGIIQEGIARQQLGVVASNTRQSMLAQKRAAKLSKQRAGTADDFDDDEDDDEQHELAHVEVLLCSYVFIYLVII